MSRAHRFRATCVLSLATVVGCHLIGGAGDLAFTDTFGTGGTGGSGGGGGGGQGGAAGGGATCGNEQVDPNEVCFSTDYVPYPTGKAAAVDMVVHDCNGDGAPDVITANQGDGTFSVLTNDGEGVLAVPESYPADLETDVVIRITLADLVGTTQPELLAVGNAGGPAEHFVDYPLGPDCAIGPRVLRGEIQGQPRDVAVFRFAGESLDDPVATVMLSGADQVFYIDSASGLGPPATVTWFDAGGTEVAGIATGDLDGDQHPDIVYVDSGANEVVARRFTGSAFIETARVAVGNGPTAVAVGDLDGQSSDDAVVANTADDSLTVLLNDGTAQLSVAAELDVELGGGTTEGSPVDVHLADMDGDGDLDILTANSNDGPTVTLSTVSLFLNDGSGTFQLATVEAFDGVHTSFPIQVGLLPSTVWAVDMNDDGALDIVTAGTHVDNGTSQVSVLLAAP